MAAREEPSEKRNRRVSINPPSDILLDVAKAADPAKSAAATERLARIAADASASDADFAGILDGVETPHSALATAPAGPQKSLSPINSNDVPTPSTAEAKAYRGIEALLLQNLFETMLPRDGEFFGEESAGGIWRSMLAQELGTDLSKRVDLGLGPKHVRGGHEVRGLSSDAAASLIPVGHVISKHS